jgi:crotonobetainyl-CoA:carnitine CoA-transferase CaiB-like acyl-CoA transferase
MEMSESQRKDSFGPLSGVKVVDLTHALAGPTCTMILADMGAETIRVEEPPKGDGRHRDSPIVSDIPQPWVRNKKSVTLNLRTDKAKEILRRLIQWGDVLVEDYRPGFMKGIGFDYPAVRELNPRMIMTSISGYGQTGPYAQRTAYDAVGAAMGGLMSVVGPADSPPMDTGTGLTDINAGVFAALGTVLALYHQQSTALGQHVESTLMESTVFLMGFNLSAYISGQLPPKGPLVNPKRTPGAGTFQAKDGTYIVIMAQMDRFWPLMARVIGREDLATAPGYTTRWDRSEHGEELQDIIQAWVSLHTIDEVEAILDEAGIPFGRVQTVPELLKDPHLKARGRFIDIDYLGKTIPSLAPYPILSDTPSSIRIPWVKTGQHNEEIYCKLLGYSQEELATFKSEGVI